MRTRLYLYLPAALALAGCAGSPGFVEENWSEPQAQIPEHYDVDAEANSGEDVIPPGARARREQRAMPGFAGGKHASSDYARPASAAPAEFDPREARPRPEPPEALMSAEEQVQQEVDAELARRSNAFGGRRMGDEQPIDLGRKPGLTRIEPRPAFDGSSGGYAPLRIEPEPGADGAYRVATPDYSHRYTRPAPAGAPPLPAGVQPGDCLTVVHAAGQYGDRMQPQWRPVLCQSERSPAMIRDLQRALLRAGFPPGPIDGVYGPRTRGALQAYQRSRFLPDDGRLHLSVLEDLGVLRVNTY